MILSTEDYKNIQDLFNVTGQIYYYYCRLIKLEKANEINSNKFNVVLNKIKSIEDRENKLVLDLSTDIKKTMCVMDIIAQRKDIINPYIIKRLLNRFEGQLVKELYNTLDRNDYFDKLQIDDLIPKIINSVIIDDICEVARYFLNQDMKNNSRDYIVSQMISFKYKDLFLKLNTVENLMDYININEILLGFDFVYEFIEQKEKRNYNDDEKKLEKTLLIQDKLFSFAEKLFDKNDDIIYDLDEMASAIILISHIKACLCMLGNEHRESIISFLSKQDKNTEAERMLISSFQDFQERDKPIIKTVHLKIK